MGNIKRNNSRPEAKIQEALIELMEYRGWDCEVTHGSVYQTGLPDIYAMHLKWGKRWIDCKVEGRYNFTPAQKIKWPKWERKGTGIWILTAATDEQYKKLFGPPNFRDYWKPSWGELPDIDKLIDELRAEKDSTHFRDC